ncbi:MAG: hypothetical protein ACREJ2_13540 [Planctomycetota bacterium]
MNWCQNERTGSAQGQPSRSGRWAALLVLSAVLCWSGTRVVAADAASQAKGENYVEMGRVAEADQDWLRAIALYDLAIKSGAELDGIEGRRQYVVDMAKAAHLDPADAAKIPDPTVRKPSATELETEGLVADAEKAERSGDWVTAMNKYNAAAALNPLNFYLISRAQNAANKAGVKRPALPQPTGPAAPPPPPLTDGGTTTAGGDAPKPSDPPATGTVKSATDTPPDKTPTATPTAPAPAPPDALAQAQKMIETLVLHRVQEAFKHPLAQRIKDLDGMRTEFSAMTEPAQRTNMLALLQRDIFTQAVGRLSQLRRPPRFGIESHIDSRNTYFYTPGGETYKLTLHLSSGTNTAFITFRVGVVPGSSPAVSTDSLKSPEGKKVIDEERRELEEWRRNQGLTERIMEGRGSYFDQPTYVFTLENPQFQAVVMSYVVEEGGVLMVYRTYSKRNGELDRELKKIIGKAQDGF